MDLHGKYRVLDGGLATELSFTHKQIIDGDPLWSARLIHSNPDVIKDVHTSFLQAGADLIETATYQASVTGFIKHLGVCSTEAENLIKKAVNIARNARDSYWQLTDSSSGRTKPLVVGSVGPYGACQADGSEYSGRYVENMTIEEFVNWHRPQVHLLVDSGVDLLAFETLPAQKEAEAIVQLLKEIPSCRAWISFSCKNESQTYHGELISDATRAVLSSDQVVAVGINCTRPIYISHLLSLIPADVSCSKDLIVYPNGGEDCYYTAEGVLQWPAKRTMTKSLHEYVGEWLNLHATWIGGCCLVGPKDIELIRSAIVDHVALATSH
jgi:homocysteine S-methyltransferase